MNHRSRTAKFSPCAVVAASLLAPSLANAQSAGGPPYSIDIEMLRPAFGHDGFVGVDVPVANRNLTVRYGTVLQFEQAPLTLYERVSDVELGSIVTGRLGAHLGVSVDVERLTFHAVVPAAVNLGSDNDAFAANGFGLGDIALGARAVVLRTPHDFFNVGIRAGISLPVGSTEAYIGEEGIRFAGGALAAFNVGPITLASDAGILTRETLVTTEDFTASNELTWGNALRYKLPAATRIAFNAQVLARTELQDFLQGGGENVLEAIGGADFYPKRGITIGVGVGRGLTEGVGSTDFRVLGHLLVEVPPAEPAPTQYVYSEPPPPPPEPPPVDPIIEEPEVEFKEDELAVKVLEQIHIRDMIEFVVDTNILQEKSRPTLQAVADIINESPEIAHLVIEGHASQEGSFEHNYFLAESRARRIWEELLGLGVASERVSYRGKGEVEPVEEGETEEALQANRRVEFHISRQFEGVDEMPDYPRTQILPWNGERVTVKQPPKPEIEEEADDVDEFELGSDEVEIEFDDDELDFDVGEPPAEPPTDDVPSNDEESEE